MSENRPLRVLVADDDPDMRLLARSLLDVDARFEVVGDASDGHQAVERAREHRPDVVLLDAAMPRLGGLDALPLLRRAAPGARVVMFTARADVRKEAARRGAAGFLEKGLSVADLAAILAGVLAESGAPDPTCGVED